MSLQPSKTDPALGHEVEAYLQKKGVATPTNHSLLALDDQDKILQIQKHYTEIMNILGLDLSDDSLEETPKRVAKMMVSEQMWGLRPENFPKATVIDNKMNYDEMVVEKGITVMSLCEHHLVVIDGKAKVAYIPDKKVLGLSKMNRIVAYFAHRPQVQERLTEQVFHALQYLLDTDDIAVVIQGVHYCVKSRGVEDSTSSTTTSKLGGRFREEPSLRAEFFSV